MAEPGPLARSARGGRPRDPANDAAILDAALDLLIERGASGASIEAIGRRAGVAKVTIYRRWRSKDELLMAALEHAREADPAPGAGATLGDLVRHTAGLLSSPRFRALMTRVVGAGVDHPQLVTTYIESYLEPRLGTLVSTAQQAIEDGQFPAGTDPQLIEDAFFSAIGYVLLRGRAPTEEEIAERLGNLLRSLGWSSAAHTGEGVPAR